MPKCQVAGTHHEKTGPMEGGKEGQRGNEGRLTAHRLRFCSCIAAYPCPYSEAGSESLGIRFWKSCQAPRRIR